MHPAREPATLSAPTEPVAPPRPQHMAIVDKGPGMDEGEITGWAEVRAAICTSERMRPMLQHGTRTCK